MLTRIMVLLFLAFACRPDQGQPAPDQDVFARQRLNMVERQLVARDIVDAAVLRVMRQVPRHLFVPPRAREYAYGDYPLAIAAEQTISQPYIVAYMTQALELQRSDKVLEIGTGSGYQAAVLAGLVDRVFTIEIIPVLGDSARQLLSRLGCDNVQVRIGDGYLGWPDQAPFDAIMVTAAPDHIPPALVAQLADGGRLVLPVGEEYQQLMRVTRGGDETRTETLLPVRFVPMTGEAQR
jgi:protein-L-isoaspartate(D-aspartate) O-methyltransferase